MKMIININEELLAISHVGENSRDHLTLLVSPPWDIHTNRLGLGRKTCAQLAFVTGHTCSESSSHRKVLDKFEKSEYSHRNVAILPGDTTFMT